MSNTQEIDFSKSNCDKTLMSAIKALGSLSEVVKEMAVKDIDTAKEKLSEGVLKYMKIGFVFEPIQIIENVSAIGSIKNSEECDVVTGLELENTDSVFVSINDNMPLNTATYSFLDVTSLKSCDLKTVLEKSNFIFCYHFLIDSSHEKYQYFIDRIDGILSLMKELTRNEVLDSQE